MKLKDYFKKAKKQKWAIGQFNFSTLEQLRGILDAANKTKSPVILGTSEGESKFLGLKEIIALVEISKMKYQISPSVPFFLNLDHGKDLNFIKKAVDYGYSAVHFDGSTLSLKKNIEYTKKIVEYAHKKGVLVEGELGYLRGESRVYKERARIKKEDLTSPLEVKRFVEETKIDSLAVVIGNIHGIYKGELELDFERLKEISKKTNVFLVLHGGSGIPKEEIKKAIKLGIVKINVNTELRLVWKKSLESVLKTQEIKPYKILPRVQKAVQKKVEEKIKLFKSENKSGQAI